MIKGKIGKLIVPTVYFLAVCLIITSIIIIINGINKFLSEGIDYKYTIDGVFEDTIPVVTEKANIIRPYISESVTIGKYFYDFEGNNEEQLNSIIYYENTYMQNSGVDYVSTSTFDIVSILDGEVLKVEKDSTLGNIVHIKHNNNLISVYQGIDNVSVEKGKNVNQGQIIGTSAKSIINPNYETSIHFEVYYKGKLMDPESIYSLTVEDLQ